MPAFASLPFQRSSLEVTRNPFASPTQPNELHGPSVPPVFPARSIAYAPKCYIFAAARHLQLASQINAA